jgi:hypothetical protein
MQLATLGPIGPARLNIRFLGILGTVASMLLADSLLVWKDFFNCADGKQDNSGIAGAKHFVASTDCAGCLPCPPHARRACHPQTRGCRCPIDVLRGLI